MAASRDPAAANSWRLTRYLEVRVTVLASHKKGDAKGLGIAQEDRPMATSSQPRGPTLSELVWHLPYLTAAARIENNLC